MTQSNRIAPSRSDTGQIDRSQTLRFTLTVSLTAATPATPSPRLCWPTMSA